MDKTMNTRLFFSLVVMLFATSSLMAQNSTFTIQPGYELTVDGSSNIHDWHADATSIEAELVLSGFNGSLESLTSNAFESLSMTIPVEDLDSGSRGLDRNLRNNLNADDFPNITFELSEVTSVEQSGDGLLITAEGSVTAAGSAHPVVMTVNATVDSEGGLQFSGTQPLKMTDFNIDPPTALLGTVRAADEFSVIYSVVFDN